MLREAVSHVCKTSGTVHLRREDGVLNDIGFRALLAITLGLVGTPAMAEAATVSGQSIKAHTAFLSDDLLEGREAGTRGYDIAAAYVATQFTLYGLKPAGANTDFYQKVPLRRRSLQPDGVRFEMRTTDGTKLYQNGLDIAVDASPYILEEDMEAELVFAGWGIGAPGLRHDDYAGLNVKGKAVVILEGAPASFPGALRAHYIHGRPQLPSTFLHFWVTGEIAAIHPASVATRGRGP